MHTVQEAYVNRLSTRPLNQIYTAKDDYDELRYGDIGAAHTNSFSNCFALCYDFQGSAPARPRWRKLLEHLFLVDRHHTRCGLSRGVDVHSAEVEGTQV